MKSISHQLDIFSESEISALSRAIELVSRLPDKDDLGNSIRCHEVARICGAILGMTVEDGYYGFVDHSWLWTTPYDSSKSVGRMGLPNILDVYCVGSLPQVRLIDGQHTSLPHVGWSYRPNKPRGDIDYVFVNRWVVRLTEDI